MRRKVFLVAGGTGGHLFPAIALTQNDEDFEYFFLLDKITEQIAKKKKIKIFQNLIVPY